MTSCAALQHNEQGCSTIRVRGHLAPRWSHWLGDMTLTHTDDGETILSGCVADQAALHGLLAKVRDMNLTLLSVTWSEPAPRDDDQLRPA